MLRKAGDFISELIREKQLSANRAEPIGTGGNAVVYASDTPGNVMKQSHIADESFPGQSLEDEANLQAIAAELGIAPRVTGLEKFLLVLEIVLKCKMYVLTLKLMGPTIEVTQKALMLCVLASS